MVIIVGPNNAGKSATLRAIEEKTGKPGRSSHVVLEISIQKEGTHRDVTAWLESTTKFVDSYRGQLFTSFRGSIDRRMVKLDWEETPNSVGNLSAFFCVLLNAEERLQAANPPDSIAVAHEGPNHPTHVLQWDDSVEQRISSHFEKAFGEGIVVHRNAGKLVPIMVGKAPEVKPGKDRLSIEYVLGGCRA